MKSVNRVRAPIHVGLDVHKDSICAAVLRPDRDETDVVKILTDDDAVRRYFARFEDPSRLRVCYEAGPTGYELHRLLTNLGVRCEVIAPALIPRAPGDKVKTDRRDCRRLARLHRAGELVAVRVPTPVRRVCATCAAPVPTSSTIFSARGAGWAASCCATDGSTATAAPGP